MTGRRHVAFPRSDARLQTVVFGGLFVARLHIEKGEIGVDELFVRPEFLGLVPFGDGGRIIAFAVVSHADGQLGVEMGRVCAKDRPELCDGGIVVARGEVEHRIVVLFLERRHSLLVKKRNPPRESQGVNKLLHADTGADVARFAAFSAELFCDLAR